MLYFSRIFISFQFAALLLNLTIKKLSISLNMLPQHCTCCGAYGDWKFSIDQVIEGTIDNFKDVFIAITNYIGLDLHDLSAPHLFCINCNNLVTSVKLLILNLKSLKASNDDFLADESMVQLLLGVQEAEEQNARCLNPREFDFGEIASYQDNFSTFSINAGNFDRTVTPTQSENNLQEDADVLIPPLPNVSKKENNLILEIINYFTLFLFITA